MYTYIYTHAYIYILLLFKLLFVFVKNPVYSEYIFILDYYYYIKF